MTTEMACSRIIVYEVNDDVKYTTKRTSMCTVYSIGCLASISGPFFGLFAFAGGRNLNSVIPV